MSECHSPGSLKEFIVLNERRYGRYAVRGHHKHVLTHALFLKVLKIKITSIRRAQVKVGLINLCKGLFSLNARIYYKSKCGT
jgi:hypothetical protein